MYLKPDLDNPRLERGFLCKSGWFSKRTGTSLDTGARRTNTQLLSNYNRIQSTLCILQSPSDVPILLLTQPICPSVLSLNNLKPHKTQMLNTPVALDFTPVQTCYFVGEFVSTNNKFPHSIKGSSSICTCNKCCEICPHPPPLKWIIMDKTQHLEFAVT